MQLSYMEEAVRTKESQDGDMIVLDCGHKIVCPPNASEYGRASAIRAHYTKFHPDQVEGRLF